MFDRFSNLSRRAGRPLRALVVALLAAIAGCDGKPEWHGAGTDAGDARPAPDHGADPGGPSDGKSR